jgi:threonyl-tRNA synthetase
MNCPGHAVMYLHKTRSWRELPLRWAEFGIVHRNELSGALSGLIRVRKFVQDDAHIFCAKEDIESEVLGCLNLMERVYSTFGLGFELILSTMPEKHLGSEDMWKVAESQLEGALKEFGKDFTVNPGDGAFYGPKIDVVLLDALRRKHQCATVQLDFNLPERFHLTYMSKQDKEETCAIIHRAILGSVERFIAILTEHFGGKWPFWISPRQARIITVNDTHIPYARGVRAKLMEAGYHVEIDDSDKTVPKKVREAQLAQFNFILVVGNDEISDETVNVRTRDNVVHGKKKIEELLKEFDELMREHK